LAIQDDLINLAYLIAFSGVIIVFARWRYPQYYQMGYEILFPSPQQKYEAKIKALQDQKKSLESLNSRLRKEKDMKVLHDQLQQEVIGLQLETKHLQDDISKLDEEPEVKS